MLHNLNQLTYDELSTVTVGEGAFDEPDMVGNNHCTHRQFDSQ
jgi:hypothetical protein